MKLGGSLWEKITFGYYAVAALIISVAVLAYVELHVIEQRMLAGERISAFFDAVLEIRRFEKNYFLYHQETDYRENIAYVAQAGDLLRENAGDFFLAPPRYASIAAARAPHAALAGELDAMQAHLSMYTALMAQYTRLPGGADAAQARLEQEIRRSGKEIVTLAETIVATERGLLRASLEGRRRNLAISIAALTLLMFAIGHALSRRVVRPLKDMEESMEAVARGSRDKLDIRSNDREIVSLTNAFNHVMQELELRQKHLLRSEKLASLGTLLSGVAHELNNPLSNISTSCQILSEELEEADAAYKRELLRQIDKQTIRARNIVRALLDFARDRVFKKNKFHIARLVDETLRFLKGEVPAGVRIHADIPADLVIEADRQRLQQVLLNMLKNAIDAIDAIDGPGEIHLRAARRDGADTPRLPAGGASLSLGRCDRRGEVVDIELRDSGQGIPPEVLPRVFDPFFTTKDVGQGSGLGLFIAYQIVEQHNGCIVVASLPGEGTVFVIRLPVSHHNTHHD
jgi:signal transduction histidine kinase